MGPDWAFEFQGLPHSGIHGSRPVTYLFIELSLREPNIDIQVLSILILIEYHGELNVLLDHVAVRSPKALGWQAIALHIDLNPGCAIRLTRQAELPRPLTDSGDGV